jgi:hypothetical protein
MKCIDSLGIPEDHTILKVVSSTPCQNARHFEQFFSDTAKDGKAEGIILRDPQAWYYKHNSFFKKTVSVIF